ncbi:MAG: hypothetical protein LBU38_01330 [Propionibacteriaceae bacterium]|nr:hypothetical protein [Propionibacteriaceae bacterium]
MKRRELEQRIARIAKAKGLQTSYSEGGNHTKLTVGNVVTFIPRHSEINEDTAKGILKSVNGAS